MTVHRLSLKPGSSQNAPTELAPEGVERQLLVDKVYAQSGGPHEAWAITEEANVSRWKLILARVPTTKDPRRFDYERLTHRAQVRPPSNYAPTVSHFTSWIYSLYGVKRKPSNLLQGLAAEAVILKERVPKPSHEDWELIHNGMSLGQIAQDFPESSQLSDRDHFDATPVFQISTLPICGSPLRANPDLVFRERSPHESANPTGRERIVIVEIKCSTAPIPPDLWPNVRAQLWAYAKIDDFVNASEVILVGEVWQILRGSCGLRRSVVWHRDDALLEQECSALFEAYSALDRRPHN